MEGEAETLEVKKKRLAEIRDFHKPINFEDIKQHKKKIDDKLKLISDKVSSQKDTFSYKRPFVSEFYKKVEEERKKM